MEELFNKNLENWKNSQLANLHNRKLQLNSEIETKLLEIEKKESEIKKAEFIPLRDGDYFIWS